MTDDNRIDPWLGQNPQKTTDHMDGSTGAQNDMNKQDSKPNWEQDVIETLAMGALKEQRRARRWSIFFKSLMFVYLFVILALYLPDDIGDSAGGDGKHTALVEIQGVIAGDTAANADDITAGLRAAFKNKNTEGVIMRINSPGGSPVQSGYVYDEIRRLRTEYPEKLIYAVVTDICASGGYYIASAADQIFADKASIVGSIGVLMDGFGFVDSMEKLGIERRLITAGDNKGFLDPFSPIKEDDMAHVRGLLDGIHQQFIDAVKSGRADRLADKKEIFSGLLWTGEQGVELGLVDGLGSSSYVAREIIQAEKIVDFTHREPYFERFVDRIGVAMANAFTSTFSGGIR